MAEIILMKTLKLLITWICYIGAGFVLVEQITGVDLEKLTNIPEPAKEILLWMLIVLWCIKIVWYVIDKVLTIKERSQKLKIEKGKNER
jgi:hypothetical protein